MLSGPEVVDLVEDTCGGQSGDGGEKARAVVGLARTGGYGANTSGDLILAFATGNHVDPRDSSSANRLLMIPNPALNVAFQATADATEEAILNSLMAAETMTGRLDRVAHRLPSELLKAFQTQWMAQTRDAECINDEEVSPFQ